MRKRPAAWWAQMSMLDCQVWLTSSLTEGSVRAAGWSLSRYESGFRALGSNQRFHRLLRHAVARALTTAPSLADVSQRPRTFSSVIGGGARGPSQAQL